MKICLFALLAIAFVCAVSAQGVTQLEFAYCDTVVGGKCADFIADYNTNVAFYIPKTDTREVQKQKLADALNTLSVATGLASPACSAVLFPFVCQNIYAKCLKFPDAHNSTHNFNLTVREPTCQSTCQEVHVLCSAFLNNPFVKAELAKQPDIQNFLYCNATDNNIEYRASFPDAPGWDIYGQPVNCKCALLKNLTANPTPVPATPCPVPSPTPTPTTAATPNPATPTGTAPTTGGATPTNGATPTTGATPTNGGATPTTGGATPTNGGATPTDGATPIPTGNPSVTPTTAAGPPTAAQGSDGVVAYASAFATLLAAIFAL